MAAIALSVRLAQNRGVSIAVQVHLEKKLNGPRFEKFDLQQNGFRIHTVLKERQAFHIHALHTAHFFLEMSQ